MSTSSFLNYYRVLTLYALFTYVYRQPIYIIVNVQTFGDFLYLYTQCMCQNNTYIRVNKYQYVQLTAHIDSIKYKIHNLFTLSNVTQMTQFQSKFRISLTTDQLSHSKQRRYQYFPKNFQLK